MINRIRIQNIFKTASRRAAPALLVLCGLLAAAAPSQDQEEDGTRRIWNKQFLEAREKAKKQPPVKTQPPVRPGTKPEAVSPGASPVQTANAGSTAVMDEELIGVTLWRLRAPATSDAPITPRLLAQNNQYVLQRVEADKEFNEGDLVRISIEAPREGDNYLYVIDREVFDNKTMSEPYLIFPSATTPPGGNVIRAGKSIYVPALGDPIPHFTLLRSGRNHVGEHLTIIISPKPLSVSVEQTKLDPGLVARWEKQWSGPAEKREARGGAGKAWTVAEKEASESGERRLVQSDPLPQTIYRVAVKPGEPAMVHVPLRIAK